MWLLDTRTIKLSQQSDDDVRYAILSHRWGNDNEEVSFDDIHNPAVARGKKGYGKIKRCCEQALRDGYEYAWVDTCCIDKRSSAELQEAINSMYRWYERAGVCYAYLQDVPLRPIEDSEWFMRGWTLQELLAPKVVQFFDEKWDFLGDQNDLVGPIRKATNIRKDVLRKEISPRDCCIAERMSWAASRKTKRVEDRAYSLFGIFQVHLPMLYGEREAAFQRLQQAILKTSEDDTLFAWTGVSKTYGGLLAPNLEAFRDGAMLRTESIPSLVTVSGAEATERSIGITVNLIPWSTDTYFVRLGCIVRGRGDSGGIGIYFRALQGNHIFVRTTLSGVDLVHLSFKEWGNLERVRIFGIRMPYISNPMDWALTRSISIRQLPLMREHRKCVLQEWIYGFRVRMLAKAIVPYRENTHWNKDTQLMWVDNGTILDGGIVGVIKGLHNPVSHEEVTAIRDVHFGFDPMFNPVLYIRKKDFLETSTSKSIDMFLEPPSSFGRSVEDFAPRVEEAHFWSEIKYRKVIDDPDRDFWALKGYGRQRLYNWYFSDMHLSIWIERTTSDEGLEVWELSLGDYNLWEGMSTTHT